MIWLKIMGGILVVLSGGGLGFARADKWRSHRKNLEELRKMTLLLRSQILYARGTLEEALEQVGKKSDGPVAQIFKETAEQLRCQDGRSFYEIWQRSVERHWKELLLTTEECREWKEFGRHLGFMDLEMQGILFTIRSTLPIWACSNRPMMRSASRIAETSGVVTTMALSAPATAF